MHSRKCFREQWASLEHPTRAVVGSLASTCYQLSWHRHSTWCLLAAILSCVQLGHDGHASADRVDLYEHEKRVVSAAHACKFDRRACPFQRSTRDSRARSDVVCPVRNCSLDCRMNRCQDIRQAAGAPRGLGIRLTFGASAFQRLERDSGRMVGKNEAATRKSYSSGANFRLAVIRQIQSGAVL